MNADLFPSLPRIRTLMTMACTPVGVGMTCRSLLHAAAAAGVTVEFFTSRYDEPSLESFAIRSFQPLAPWLRTGSLGRAFTTRRLHRAFLGEHGEGDIAYLWPSVPLSVYQELSRRGAVIVTEAINTRMPFAKRILDEAYASVGLPPAHGITQARIADQTARYELTNVIFAPSPATEESLYGSALSDRFIGTSYGTWVPSRAPVREIRKSGQPVTFLFVGSLGIRKGGHLLLQAWRHAPSWARLRIVGNVELPIRKLFGDVLNSPTVTCTGFKFNVSEEYRRADVFVLPSLEEGDPIVTYEAAAHGLPIIASAMGSGRIGAETGCVQQIGIRSAQDLIDRIDLFSRSEDLRREWGERARSASLQYDWSVVAPQRFQKLSTYLREGAFI